MLCETYVWADSEFTKKVPANTNFRHFAQKIFEFESVKKESPWFGIEQEYMLLEEQNEFTT